jgi:hypothetical protein
MADQDLGAIRDAWDKTTGGGRDEDRARELADQYVAAHPDKFTSLQDMSLEQCVQAVDVFRAANMVDDQWRVEAWLLHKFEAQNIGGAAAPTVRIK